MLTFKYGKTEAVLRVSIRVFTIWLPLIAFLLICPAMAIEGDGDPSKGELQAIEANQYIVPGSSHNYVRYRWYDSGGVNPETVTMEVRDQSGNLVRSAGDLPTTYLSGEDCAEYTWDGKNSSGGPLTEGGSPYTIKLIANWTSGSSGAAPPQYISGRWVKKWNISVLFWDRLSDNERGAIDTAYEEAEQEYDSTEDEFFCTTQDAGPYCAGVALSTVTSSSVSVSKWFWYQDSTAGVACTVDDGVSTTTLSGNDWLASWGDKQWYDDRGSTLNSVEHDFYSMDDDQSYYVRIVIADSGAKDLAGNCFDGSDGSSDDQHTVTYELRIDGEGTVTIIDEVWQ